MIISCPACSTRYVVPETAIGVDGRTVRCAKCRHSWFQEGPELTDDRPVPPAAVTTQPAPPPPAPSPAADPVAAEPSPSGESAPDPAARPGFSDSCFGGSDDPRGDGPGEEPRSARASMPPLVDIVRPSAHSHGEQESSQFDRAPPFRPRRNPIRIWTAAAIIFATLAFGTIFAVSYYGLPDWVPVSRPTFGARQPDLVLNFPADKQDRRTLPNGTEYFGASGTVTNVGRETRKVPSILIVMRDQRERPVYSWEVVPPKASLAPGESMRIDGAAANVPKSAKVAEIGWKPG